MTARLPLLLSRGAWERVAADVTARHLPIDPVILSPDGRLSRSGRDTTIEQAGIRVAWFGPELFGIGQDEHFLSLVQQCEDLEWLQSGRAGLDHPVFAVLAGKGVRLTRSNGPAPAIAEYVLGAVLDRFQRGPERRQAQVDHRWQAYPFREVAGSRWVCVGFGEIGRHTARRARALGAYVTGVRRSAGDDPDADAMVAPDAMAAALGAADVVVLSVPLTAESENAYGATFFAAMADGATFVNVGRGPLVDEDALQQALAAGRPEHAILDVTRIEPLPSQAWHWDHPQVTLTAHTSGIGSGLLGRTDAIFIENLARFCAGDDLLLNVSAKDLA